MSLLFEEALLAVPPSDRAILDDLRARNPQATVEDVLSAVRQKRQYCLNTRLKFKRPGGKLVDLQDVFAKIAVWLQKFREIGDIAVQYDPAHLTLPWAALRFLLQAFINDTQSLAHVAEGLEVITKNYSRCALVEKALLRNANTASALVTKLRTAIVSFYSTTLIYLAHASKFYHKKPQLRFLQNALKTTPALAKEMDAVCSKVEEVQRFISDVTAEAVQDQKEISGNLLAQLALFEAPLKRWDPIIDRINDRLLAEERSKILDWISPIAYHRHHEQHFRDIVQGTAAWLQQNPSFVKWQNSSTSTIFWLKGNPGWGKTKLASALIQSMHEDAISNGSQIRPAYFYCSSSDSGSFQYTTADVLRSIVRQISVSNPSGAISQEMQDIYQARLQESVKEGFSPTSLTADESTDLILHMAGQRPVTIVIDGIDELGQDIFTLSHALSRLIKEAPLLTKIFVTSRHMQIADFQNLYTMPYVITAKDNAADITKFVQQRTVAVIKEKRLLEGRVSQLTQSRIVRDLSDGADGMFLWASLQLSNICDGSRFVLEQDILTSLNKLSKGLSDTFANILDRILQYESSAKNLTCSAIAWLLAAKRPLTKDELLAACIFGMNNDSVPFLPDEKQLVTLCGSLIVFDEEQYCFQFLHSSVREYLSGRSEFSNALIHKVALERCLACYTKDLDTEMATGRISNKQSAQVLHSYACCYWMEHYQELQDDRKLSVADGLVTKFVFEAEGVFFALWLNDLTELFVKGTTWTPKLQRLRAVLSTSGTPILTSAAYDIPCVLEQFARKDHRIAGVDDVNESNFDDASAVYICARYGSKISLQAVLRMGGLPNVTGGHMKTPLQAAAFWGHASCVEILLEHGADHKVVGRFPNSLSAALAGGNEATTLLFVLKHLYEDSEAGSLLSVAASRGFDQVIRVLSEHKRFESAEVNHEYLQNALAHGSLQATKVWIKKITDINASCGHYGNALQAAAFGGNETCVSLLIDAGASIDTGGLYGSALKAAALKGNHRVVGCLLQHGARDSTALVAAAQNGHLSTLHTLLDTLERESEMQTTYSQALHAASLAGQSLAVDMLLTRYGPSQYTHIEQQALHQALYSGNTAVFDVFFKHYHSMRGISHVQMVPCSLGKGPSLIHHFEPFDRAESIAQYIDKYYAASFGCSAGSDGPYVVEGGDTMRLAARLGDPVIIEALLSARYSAKGSEDFDSYQSRALPIEVAAAYGQVNAIDILLQHGSELGRSLVFATRFGQIDVVRHILTHVPETEVDINATDFEVSFVEDRHFRSSLELSNDSALGLAIDIDDYDIFEILWDSKMKSKHPIPNASLIRALSDERQRYLYKILGDSHRWRTSDNLVHRRSHQPEPQFAPISGLEIEKVMTCDDMNIKSAKDNWFEILGDESCAPNESENIEVMTALECAIREASSKSAYEVLKLLIESEPDRVTRHKLIYEAASSAGSSHNFVASNFLDACALDGFKAALLIEIVISCALSHAYGHYRQAGAETFLLKLPEMMEVIKSLYAANDQLFDLCLARLCRKVITENELSLAHTILNDLGAERKPLQGTPDILHDVLDAINSSSPSELSHLPGVFDLLSRYGADLNSVRTNSLLVRLCFKGLSDCFFFMIGRQVLMPNLSETFPLSRRASGAMYCGFGSIYHSSTSPDNRSSPSNLIGLTIRGFLDCTNGSGTCWKKSLSPGHGAIIHFLRTHGYQYNLDDPKLAEFCRIVCYQNNEILLAQILQTAKGVMGDQIGSFLDRTGLLHAAVLGGHCNLARSLISQGADMNYSTTWSFPCKNSHPKQGTPVEVATYDGLRTDLQIDPEARIWLLGNLLEENVSQIDRQRIFSYAMKEVVKHVDCDPYTPSETGEHLVYQLLHESVDVTAAQYNLPYLEVVIRHRRTGWLTYLFEKGLDPGTISEELLKVATELGHVETVQVLYEKFRFASGTLGLDSIIDKVVRKDNVDLLTVLKHAKYDIDRPQEVRSYNGFKRQTLLSKECSSIQPEPVVVERLLQHGANSNAIVDGWTPLTTLLSNNMLHNYPDTLNQCTKLLLQSGCDPNLPHEMEFEGQTIREYPVHFAISWEHYREALKLLVEAGADMSADGGFGTPLFQAKWWVPDKVAKIISLVPTAVDKPGKFSFIVENGKKFVRLSPQASELFSKVQVEDGDSRMVSVTE